MKIGGSGWITLLGAVLALAGCVNPAAERAASLERARAQCAAHGKQFVPTSQEETGTANITTWRYTLVGRCVGPGDPGYVDATPPAAPPH